jgi:prevent-host-death family protein
MTTISANELKTRGASVLDAAVVDDEEAVITVRGRNRYVVLTMDAYNRLRECELEAALQQVKREVREGKGIRETVAEHIRRIRR